MKFKQNIWLVTVCYLLFSCGGGSNSSETEQIDPPSNTFNNISLQRVIESVQPMTGIVFWDDNYLWNSSDKDALADAISLEYSYIPINEIVSNNNDYDWSYIDNKLADISARNHQAIFRMYYSYPGRATTVPQYIKNLAGYNETEGISEGLTTYFPDWTNEELKSFTKAFHTKFAERYDNDNRIAFIQVGFGLWGEYHIYDEPGTLVLGETFPSKAYQAEFVEHLSTTYTDLPWSISIDASNVNNTPFDSTELTGISFGLFDDSFMSESHSGYNETALNFFNYHNRFELAPFGGEFSYLSATDQRNVLTPTVGAYGKSYEEFAADFYVTYMIGNDTYTGNSNEEQPISRIKEASMASGYQFSVIALSANATQTKITIQNTGVAPIYYDAFVRVNGVKAAQSLKGLLPNASQEHILETSAESTTVEIVSDHILPSQVIGFNADL